LETLFRRIPTLEVIPDQPLEFAPTMTVSMLHHLKVRWT
jgi:cytochrome P450